MFSWEMTQQRDESTLIAMLTPPGGVSVSWAIALSELEKPPNSNYMRVEGMPFGEARTYAANELLKQGIQWLFFLDCDLMLPRQTIVRLISHRLPIVSVLYHQKFPEWTGTEALHRPVMLRIEPDGTPRHVVDYSPGALLEVDFVGAGALLIHRTVFERMLQAGIKRFFEWTMHADNPNPGLSEDYEFCLRAKSVGFKVYADTSLIGLHETTAVVNHRGMKVKP